MFFILAGCDEGTTPETDALIRLPASVTYQGFDINGKYTDCTVESTNACTEVYGPDEEFMDECASRGYEVFTCGCHSYLCKENIVKEVLAEREGIDIEGVIRSCTPLAEGTVCTEVFTEEDAYAVQCEEDGGEAVQCGCHDWICIK